jgi:hypothetical protein
MDDPIAGAVPGKGNFSLLVLGAGRSGTSLLAAMLDQHPAIEMGMEAFANDTLRGKGLDEHRETMFQQRSDSFIHAFRTEAASSSAAIWGNKITTEQLGGLKKHNYYNRDQVDVLGQFLGRKLAGCRIIYILRDGRACIQSKMNRVGAPLERACEQWQFAVEVYEYLQNRTGSYSLRFEDLVANPEQEIVRVLEFLGLDYDDRVLEGTMSEKMMMDYRRPVVDSSRGLDIMHDHPCVELVGAELARCGYL